MGENGKARQGLRPFSEQDSFKVGIIGSRGTGKSYLFHGIVYRTYDARSAGALSYYLKEGSVHLYSAPNADVIPIPRNLAEFVDPYINWLKLMPTTRTEVQWYQLHLEYRTGFFGGTRSAMDVEFIDGAGEQLQEPLDQGDNAEVWEKRYGKARVMVFVVPIWALFPAPRLHQDDRARCDDWITHLTGVIDNYREMRKRSALSPRVRTVLALTSGDDARSRLVEVRQKWIRTYIGDEKRYLEILRTGGGIVRYLANAARISQYMTSRFQDHPDPRVSAIPRRLDFGGGLPWIIPMSAVDGTHISEDGEAPRSDLLRERRPVPVHVELPVLMALCQKENTLV